jgi:hypothetical protein
MSTVVIGAYDHLKADAAFDLTIEEVDVSERLEWAVTAACVSSESTGCVATGCDVSGPCTGTTASLCAECAPASPGAP